MLLGGKLSQQQIQSLVAGNPQIMELLKANPSLAATLGVSNVQESTSASPIKDQETLKPLYQEFLTTESGKRIIKEHDALFNDFMESKNKKPVTIDGTSLGKVT